MKKKNITSFIIILLVIILSYFMYYNKGSIEKWWQKEISTCKRVNFNLRYLIKPEGLYIKNGGVAQWDGYQSS